MFKKIYNWLFKQPSDLELYIQSKNPTNAAEVDFWSTQYSYRKESGGYL